MDDLAEALGLDRWAIRRLNALGSGDRTPSGQVLAHSAGLPECLDALKDDWATALADAATHKASEPRRRRGVGIGCMWYGCGNTALPNPSTMRIALSRDGTLTFFNGAVDIGQGSTTVLTQIAADALGVAPETFQLVVGDTGLTADAGKTSASRQTFVSGKAAMLAGRDLRRKILALANVGESGALALEGATLVIGDGDVRRRVDLGGLAADGSGTVLEGRGAYDPPTTTLDADGQGVPYATYGFAAQMAEVEVDVVLGTTKVLRMVAAHDVGRAVNPTLVEGQIHGGIAQGLGFALMEEFIPGRTENLHDYLIPTVGDMPEIDIRLIEDPEPEGPFGAKGVGEPALVATAPAILSAIRHATGVTLREVPVLPHRLWAAMQQRPSRETGGGGGGGESNDDGLSLFSRKAAVACGAGGPHPFPSPFRGGGRTRPARSGRNARLSRSAPTQAPRQRPSRETGGGGGGRESLDTPPSGLEAVTARAPARASSSAQHDRCGERAVVAPASEAAAQGHAFPPAGSDRALHRRLLLPRPSADRRARRRAALGRLPRC